MIARHDHLVRLPMPLARNLERRLVAKSDEVEGQQRLPYLNAAIWLRGQPGFTEDGDYVDLFAPEALWRALHRFCRKRLAVVAEEIRVQLADVFNGS